MTFKFNKPEDSPGLLLWQITHTWQRQQRDALSKLNLTHAQFVVLTGILWLSMQSGKNITQQQVSDFTHIDKMSMSELVKALVTKKMLMRERAYFDRRAYSLSLTKKGYDLVNQAIPIVESIDECFFNGNNPELTKLMSILNSK